MEDDIYRAIFRIAEHLELPVIIAALLALAVVLAEVGAYVTETVRRTKRQMTELTRAAEVARRSIDAGDRTAAAVELGFSEARVDLAMVLLEDGEDLDRVDDLLTAAAADGEPDAAHQLGLLRLRQDAVPEAVELLERAHAEDPSGTVADSLARGLRYRIRLRSVCER